MSDNIFFELAPTIGLVCVYDHHVCNYDVKGKNDISYLTDEDSKNGFKQYQPELVLIFLIGDHTANVQFDIRLNKSPSTDRILHAIHVPFRVQSDSGIRVDLPFYESQLISIPQGDYLLTVHQAYTGSDPLGPPENISNIESIKWLDVPTSMRMYFNPVDSLEGIVAKSHRHSSREFAW